MLQPQSKQIWCIVVPFSCASGYLLPFSALPLPPVMKKPLVSKDFWTSPRSVTRDLFKESQCDWRIHISRFESIWIFQDFFFPSLLEKMYSMGRTVKSSAIVTILSSLLALLTFDSRVWSTVSCTNTNPLHPQPGYHPETMVSVLLMLLYSEFSLSGIFLVSVPSFTPVSLSLFFLFKVVLLQATCTWVFYYNLKFPFSFVCVFQLYLIPHILFPQYIVTGLFSPQSVCLLKTEVFESFLMSFWHML